MCPQGNASSRGLLCVALCRVATLSPIGDAHPLLARGRSCRSGGAEPGAPATLVLFSRSMALLSTRQTLILLLWLCDICLYMARTNVSVAVASMFPSDSSEGNLLSAFYWGYMLFQIPAGWLASRFGGSAVLVMAVVVWSVASASSCFTGGNLPALFALRVVVGCAESCTYPSMSQLASVWFPYEERGTCWAIITTLSRLRSER